MESLSRVHRHELEPDSGIEATPPTAANDNEPTAEVEASLLAANDNELADEQADTARIDEIKKHLSEIAEREPETGGMELGQIEAARRERGPRQSQSAGGAGKKEGGGGKTNKESSSGGRSSSSTASSTPKGKGSWAGKAIGETLKGAFVVIFGLLALGLHAVTKSADRIMYAAGFKGSKKKK